MRWLATNPLHPRNANAEHSTIERSDEAAQQRPTFLQRSALGR
jgi:hypothetical protein